MLVTYPFHPLVGQRVEVLYSKCRGGVQVLVCDAGRGATVTVPVTWTDRGPAAEDHYLCVDGLVELHVLVNALLAGCGGLGEGGSS